MTDPYETLGSDRRKTSVAKAYSKTNWRRNAAFLVLFLCCVFVMYQTPVFSLGRPMQDEISIEILSEGDQKHYPKDGDTVTVNYIGTLAVNGLKFDSSYDRQDPFQFVVGHGEVIAGWDQALLKLSLNEKCRVWIPSHLAYGEMGAGREIPPNADLYFDIHLIGINDLEVDRTVDVQVLVPGDGKTFPKSGDVVTVHYVGTFLNGAKFDSSRDRDSPFTFKLGKRSVIKGWEEGIPQLSIGEKARLTIPYQLAYGESGRSGIPPKSDLIFEVELLKIN